MKVHILQKQCVRWMNTLCEFVDKLNELGYDHRIAITDNSKSCALSEHNETSEEIREFFDR